MGQVTQGLLDSRCRIKESRIRKLNGGLMNFSSKLRLGCALFALAGTSAANAGVVVAAGDEWTLSDYAYQAPYVSGTTAYVQDIVATFGGSSYLLLTGNGNVSVSLLQGLSSQLSSLGKTVDNSPTFDLTTASNYDAVFHFGQGLSASQFTDLSTYVGSGGNAYVSLGSGWYGTAAGEAAAWNPFLSEHGLVAGDTWFTDAGFVEATVTQGPTGATSLLWGYGQSIEPILGSAGISYVRGSFAWAPENVGLVGSSAVLGAGAPAVPEPGSWMMLIAGFGMLGGLMRSRPGVRSATLKIAQEKAATRLRIGKPGMSAQV